MKAYSLDLRQRIVDAVDKQLGTYREIATTFGVHESYIYKLLRQRRQTGDLAPRPHGGGASAKLNEAQLLTLGDLVAQDSDATIEELRRRLQKRVRVAVSTSTVWRALELLKLSRKKSRAGRRKPTP
jgi:transposase